MENTKVTHQEGKAIRTTEHPDGRKDVAIGVETLEVDRNDSDTKKAAEIIEKDVLPKVLPKAMQQLVDEPVHILLIHTPSCQFSQLIVKRKEVLSFVTQSMNKWREVNNHLNVDDFIAVVLTNPQKGQQVQVETARKIT